MLPQDFEQRLLDLHRIDRHVVLLQLCNLAVVYFHKFYIWIFFYSLQVVIYDFVVIVNTIYVF